MEVRLQRPRVFPRSTPSCLLLSLSLLSLLLFPLFLYSSSCHARAASVPSKTHEKTPEPSNHSIRTLVGEKSGGQPQRVRKAVLDEGKELSASILEETSRQPVHSKEEASRGSPTESERAVSPDGRKGQGWSPSGRPGKRARRDSRSDEGAVAVPAKRNKGDRKVAAGKGTVQLKKKQSRGAAGQTRKPSIETPDRAEDEFESDGYGNQEAPLPARHRSRRNKPEEQKRPRIQGRQQVANQRVKKDWQEEEGEEEEDFSLSSSRKEPPRRRKQAGGKTLLSKKTRDTSLRKRKEEEEEDTSNESSELSPLSPPRGRSAKAASRPLEEESSVPSAQEDSVSDPAVPFGHSRRRPLRSTRKRLGDNGDGKGDRRRGEGGGGGERGGLFSLTHGPGPDVIHTKTNRITRGFSGKHALLLNTLVGVLGLLMMVMASRQQARAQRLLAGVRRKEQELQEAARRAQAQPEKQSPESSSATTPVATAEPARKASFFPTRFLPAFLTPGYAASDTGNTQSTSPQPQRPIPPAGLFDDAYSLREAETLEGGKEEPSSQQSQHNPSQPWLNTGLARRRAIPGESLTDFWGGSLSRRIVTTPIQHPPLTVPLLYKVTMAVVVLAATALYFFLTSERLPPSTSRRIWEFFFPPKKRWWQWIR